MLIVGVQQQPVKLSFSEWLKVTRDRTGVTQARLAAELQVRPQTISNWENGVSSPSLDPVQMLKLCTLLKVSLEELAIAYQSEGHDA
ncbi:helix-turn-helix transcriptional regulator [Oculatella sp. LEGE 06141]|uniref:helix-turn-helix transcriptional regulator n=1 Tax=Oculatella sp. LEGE 06141 TaxID=1828648 RepID=UPI001880575F|nr:helix-turn-helix transcriptional regulator [Oculatella sp. LEGE 06141]MBE9178630.1 helix-turn-helix transcriptional regulator [Oculatella sp. LEGE 06141]